MPEQARQTQTNESGSPTGAFPSVGQEPGPHEPPAPRTLPEDRPAAAATGVFRVLAEGEDAARQRDDSPSGERPLADDAPAQPV